MGVPAATTSPLVRRYTLEEFYQLEPPPGGGHYELIAGVLYMVPPPTRIHNLVVSVLVRELSRYADTHRDRCMLFVLRAAVWTPADTYLEPDLFLIASEHLERALTDDWTSADLVVEVLSPSTAVYDRSTKADTYAMLGVRELWLVDLEKKSIEQRVLEHGTFRVVGSHAGEAQLESPIFPGLAVLPAVIFG